MSSMLKSLSRCYTIDIVAATGLVSAAMLLGQTGLARPAVFEQMDNGHVVQLDSGGSEDAPLSGTKEQEFVRNYPFERSLPAVPAGYSGKEQPDPARPTGAVLVDIATSTSSRAPRHPLAQPNPNRLSASLSPQQARMHLLTARIGRSFARQPGVIRARLDEATFVELFTAMIHRESNFNPNAVSPVGAGGLGQLMPATARELGVCDVFSAHDNLTGAARYLTSMLDQFGSAELALAAYNAGPGAVRKYGGIPPYRETRQYVADIIGALSRKPEPQGQLLAYGGDANPHRNTAEASIMANFEIDDPIPGETADCRHTP